MTLQQIAEQTGTDKAWHGFPSFYESALPRKVKRLLEIGVHEGQSLEMWKAYYPDAEIIGGEFDENNFYNQNGIVTHCVNQDERESLRALIDKVGFCDVIVDDGGHTMKQQQNTIKELLPYCKFLVVEDLHTSLYTGYKGRSYGVGDTKHTTLEYIKTLKGVKVKIFEHYHDNDCSITAVIENV